MSGVTDGTDAAVPVMINGKREMMFRCRAPDCPKAYRESVDLKTHVQLRHPGLFGAAAASPLILPPPPAPISLPPPVVMPPPAPAAVRTPPPAAVRTPPLAQPGPPPPRPVRRDNSSGALGGVQRASPAPVENYVALPAGALAAIKSQSASELPSMPRPDEQYGSLSLSSVGDSAGSIASDPSGSFDVDRSASGRMQDTPPDHYTVMPAAYSASMSGRSNSARSDGSTAGVPQRRQTESMSGSPEAMQQRRLTANMRSSAPSSPRVGTPPGSTGVLSLPNMPGLGLGQSPARPPLARQSPPVVKDTYVEIALPPGDADTTRAQFYFRDVKREDAEALLARRPVGTFVLRPSAQAAYALTFVNDQGFGHALVHRHAHGFSLESLPDVHPTVDVMLHHFKLLNWTSTRTLPR
jgi:hypothetical protein